MLAVQQLFSSFHYLSIFYTAVFKSFKLYLQLYFNIDTKCVLENHCTKYLCFNLTFLLQLYKESLYLCFNLIFLLQLYKESPELKRHFYFKTDPLTSQIDNLSPTSRRKVQVIIESLSNHSGEIIINCHNTLHHMF